ncbi:MAG: heparan N-sulfatase, partial [Verrucomicrobiota bacterium]
MTGRSLESRLVGSMFCGIIIHPHFSKSIRELLICVILPIFSIGGLPAAEKPNFVFINADDLTYRDLSVYGGQAHTPNFERMAREGMKFTRCFQ